MYWQSILVGLGVRHATASRWDPVFKVECTPEKFSLGEAEIPDFLGQVLHESGHLERMEENLNYSAERMCVIWPSRFPSVGAAAPFARNPEALANKVYGGRLGNTSPGDGWKYRGRGLLQVTGRDNYTAVGKAIGVDLVAKPELMATPAIALRASIAWWEKNVPDSVMGDIVRVSKRVNGGTIGLDERRKLTDAARKGLA